MRIDSVGLFAKAAVWSRHNNDRPSLPVHPTRTIPKPHPFTPRNPGASPTAGDGELGATHATPISLGSTAVLGLALPPVAGLPEDTTGLQTGYPGALAPQGLSTVLDLEVSLPDRWAPTHRT